MKFTTFVVLALVSFGLNAAGKTAYINAQKLLEESPQAVAVKNQLRDQFGDRENKLRDMLGKIQQMEQTYQNDSAIMSAEQKKKAEENIVQNKRRFQFEQQSLKQDLQAAQRNLVKDMEKAIKAVIQAYGKQQGYDFIFTETSIAFAAESKDITDEILEQLKK